jgi:hypothetical protein
MLKALQSFFLALFFFTVTASGVAYIMDNTRYSDDAHESASAPEEDAGLAQGVQGRGRVFVLLVESFRARSASNPDLMPYVGALKERGFSAELATVDEAATYGPMRAAFTGREDLKSLGAFSVFLGHAPPVSSIFSQLKNIGFRSIIYADQWTFHPFHQDVTSRFPQRAPALPVAEGQTAQLRSALSKFLTHQDQLVVFQLSLVDGVAHRFGVAHLEYRQIMLQVDALIRELDQSLPAEDHLVIMGDHGHTDSGRHGPGLDVPTVFLGRGPVFSRGMNAGLLPMTSVRYLLSRALNISPLKNYAGPRPLDLPEGGAEKGLLERSLAVSASQHQDPKSGAILFATALAIGFFFSGFWLFFSRRAGEVRRQRWAHLLGFCCGILMISAMGFGLGWFVPPYLGVGAPLPDYVLNQVWAALLLLGALGVWAETWSAADFGIVVFALPFLLLYPSILSLGAPSVFAPCWMVTAVLQSTEFIKHAPSGSRVPRYRRQTLVWTALLVTMMQPFFHVESRDLVLGQFGPLIHEMVPTSLYPRSLVSGLVTWMILNRRGQHLWNKVLAVVLAFYVILLQLRIIPENHWGCLGFGLALLGLAFASLRNVSFGSVTEKSEGLARSLFLGALLVFTFYTIRLGHEVRTDLILVFGATRVSALLSARCSRSTRDLQRAATLTLFLGLVGVGWMTLGWGLARVEWGFLYEFVSHDLVSRRIGHFLPLILLRYVFPVLVVRMLVTEVLVGKTTLPRRTIGLALGLKYVVLMATLLGAGASSGGSPQYVGVLAQIGVFLLLVVGLL